MNYTNINTVDLIDIDDDEIENLTVVNPIESMSKEQNDFLLELVKQRLKDSNKPEKWMTWEQFEKLAKDKFNV